jgi:hypothetical protein
VSGSGGDTGYDYQADAVAYIAAHALCGQPLPWFEDHSDIPVSWSAETGGPGDDIRLVTIGHRPIEIQVKHGLTRGKEYDNALQQLADGLNRNSKLRAILMVERGASKIIREDLRLNILRLGQGRFDGIKNITRDLIAELTSRGVADMSIFARLRIVVVDLDDGSDGLSSAQALLSRVVAAKDSPTAYQLLGKRGHGLIKNRGRDDVVQCARFLENAIGLAPDTRSLAISLVLFTRWIRASNETFYCPALQRRFPIGDAWNRVVQLASGPEGDTPTAGPDDLGRQIERYREWSRLAGGRDRDRALAAESFLSSRGSFVIIGGPGAGKTIVSRRLAFFAAEDRLSVRVRLPIVAALLSTGLPFERALAEAVVDSSGYSVEEGRQILAGANLLIADGLDECDPRRADVAASLSAWASSHPDIKIVVTTRAIGHSPWLLPGFLHVELIPLERGDIQRIAGSMIRAVVTDLTVASSKLELFMGNLDETGNVASLAARNPLLLSFLVRLFIDGQSIEGKRAAIFGKIVELIRVSERLERRSPESNVDRATAWAAAEAAGWSSIEQPDRPLPEIYELIAKRLGTGIDALRRAELAVNEWGDRGLTERLSAGSLDALSFVHPALGEYLAGRYLAQMSSAAFQEEIEKRRRKAKWRESILLAAGVGACERIVQALLPLDSPDDPASNEACLAALALAEVDGEAIPDSTVRIVVEQLVLRLRSTVPLIAIDAGEALAGIAHLVPDFVASRTLGILDHKQAWTRLTALCCGLCTGSASIPLEIVLRWIENFEMRPDFLAASQSVWSWGPGSEELYRVYKLALPRALVRVAKELPEETAEEKIRAFLSQSYISVGLVEAIQNGLTEEPYSTWVNRSFSQMIKASVHSMQSFVEGMSPMQAAQVNVLLCVLTACGHERVTAQARHSEFPVIGELFGSMGYWELTLRQLFPAGVNKSDAMLIEVFRGMIAGLSIDADRLARETNAWLDHLSVSQDWFYPSRSAERELDCERVLGASLNLDVIARALQHPSWFVAWNAARLFEISGPTARHSELLKEVLDEGDGATLYIVGALADSVWGNDAFGVLYERLGTNRKRGCAFLYGPMIKAARNPSEVDSAVLKALEGIAGDSEFAQAAVEALGFAEVRAVTPYFSTIKQLFSDWQHKTSWCDKCQKRVDGYSCDSCHVVPKRPDNSFVVLLSRIGALDVHELLGLARNNHHGVGEEARKAIVSFMLHDSSAMTAVISEISSKGDCERVLPELLKQQVDELTRFSEQILSLLQSSHQGVRATVIDSFGSGWLAATVAREFAVTALEDDGPQVRSAAARFLKRQSEA